ncbi:hypothetical protein EDD85DRAFT_797944 [Armillaria nabsnona]|nr:hypothetical protein EDD85DRAFT_797944 [Armillaria nabsnona]
MKYDVDGPSPSPRINAVTIRSLGKQYARFPGSPLLRPWQQQANRGYPESVAAFIRYCLGKHESTSPRLTQTLISTPTSGPQRTPNINTGYMSSLVREGYAGSSEVMGAGSDCIANAFGPSVSFLRPEENGCPEEELKIVGHTECTSKYGLAFRWRVHSGWTESSRFWGRRVLGELATEREAVVVCGRLASWLKSNYTGSWDSGDPIW